MDIKELFQYIGLYVGAILVAILGIGLLAVLFEHIAPGVH